MLFLFGLLLVFYHAEIDRQRPDRQHQRRGVAQEAPRIVVLLGDLLGFRLLFGFLVLGGGRGRRRGNSRSDKQYNELLHMPPCWPMRVYRSAGLSSAIPPVLQEG